MMHLPTRTQYEQGDTEDAKQIRALYSQRSPVCIRYGERAAVRGEGIAGDQNVLAAYMLDVESALTGVTRHDSVPAERPLDPRCLERFNAEEGIKKLLLYPLRSNSTEDSHQRDICPCFPRYYYSISASKRFCIHCLVNRYPSIRDCPYAAWYQWWHLFLCFR